MIQFTDAISNPFDKLKVLVVGVGGTGTKLAIHLTRISHSLKEMGKLPLDIILMDDDVVEPYNIGRQNFYSEDIGEYKASIMANRLFNSYNVPVRSFTEKLSQEKLKTIKPDFIFSCVDKMQPRYLIDNYYNDEANSCELKAWFDTGNESNFGQVFITDKKTQPGFKETFGVLEDDLETPSCSMAQSLSKQDLFINDFSALTAANAFWSALNDLKIDYTTKHFNSQLSKVL